MTGPLVATRSARYAVVRVELPGRGAENVGVLLEDASTDTLHIRFRRDWIEMGAAEDDVEVLELLAEDLAVKAREMGARELLQWLETHVFGTVQISDFDTALVDDYERTLNRLYRRHVTSNVLEFRTHLPKYTLRVAAGKFLENDEVTAEGWVEAPEDLRVTPDLFVARIQGHSMEPLIPDGSLCVFRYGVTGSRQGRLVLVEDTTSGGVNRYTVKRYVSEKAPSEDGSWRHTRIRLESLNPGYPSWDLDPDDEKYRIVGEFQRVLE
jgi:SOS-response transcriptional repressor LexA